MNTSCGDTVKCRLDACKSPIFRSQSPCTYINIYYVQESQRFLLFRTYILYTYKSTKGLIYGVGRENKLSLGIFVKVISQKAFDLSRPQTEPCVPAFPRQLNEASTHRLTSVDYAALSNKLGADQLGAIGRQRIHVHVTCDKTQS